MIKKQNRILWLDALKGYGIILVMLSHTLPYNEIMGILYSGFMALFFMASGYTDNKTFTRDVVIRKSKSLLIPYFIYGVVECAFFDIVFAKQITYQGGTIHEWVGLIYARFCLYQYGTENNIYFLPIEATSPLWFLPALYTGFMVYYIFKKICNGNVKKTYALYGAMLLITVFLNFLPNLLPWSLDVVFLVAFFIFLGNRMRYRYQTKMSISQGALVLLSFCVYVLAAYYNGFVNFSIREFGKYEILSLFLFLVIGLTYFIVVSGLFCLLPKIITKIFSRMGILSLRLMCIQMPIFFVVGKVFKLYSIQNNFLEVSIKLLLVLIIAYIMELVLNHMQRYLIVVKYL